MEDIAIRECTTIDEFDNCVRLQREVFKLPDLEISPRRHLIVSRQAGGWTLGAFVGESMVGFVHHLAAVHGGNDVFGYSHMMAVDPRYQNKGVGARLKWSQRERAIKEGRNFIKWTWDPMQARNAHFNLNRLGVTVSSYAENFYGTDYSANIPAGTQLGESSPGIDSDRLFAHWLLKSERVENLAKGLAAPKTILPTSTIEIPADWAKLSKEEPAKAKQEQLRVRSEFQKAFGMRLICAGFDRSITKPTYLLYDPKALDNG